MPNIRVWADVFLTVDSPATTAQTVDLTPAFGDLHGEYRRRFNGSSKSGE